jgi:hypothetical protein
MENDQDYLEKSGNIRQLASMPADQLIDHMTSIHPNISHTAPNIAPHIFSSASNAVQFLNNKLPNQGNELPGDQDAKPSIAQRNAWLDLHEAVNNPISVLDHVNQGTLNSHHLEALQTVYPDLYQEMSQKILENLGESKSKDQSLPYQKRLSISKFIGQPVDSTMTPESMLTILNSAGPNQGPNAQAQKSPKRASGTELKQINKVNDLYQTPEQTRQELKRK